MNNQVISNSNINLKPESPVQKKKRNGDIDVLRFIFSLVILIFHFNSFFNFGAFQSGFMGVGFFFIVTGYLMAVNVEKNFSEKTISPKELADSTWKFLINKMKSFWCYYISVIVLTVVVRFMIIRQQSILEIIESFLSTLPTLSLTFLGYNYGKMEWYIGNTWFLSSMIIAIFILFPILTKSYHIASKIIFPIASLFILGYLYKTFGSLVNWQGWTGVCYTGILIGIGEIALGVSLRPLLVYLADKFSWLINSKNILIKLVLTTIKILAYLVVLISAYKTMPNGKIFSVHALLFCAIGILFSFLNAGFCIPDCRFTRFLGKLSLPIYIYHGFIRLTCKDLIPTEEVTPTVFILMLVIAVIGSILFMYITDLILKLLSFIGQKIKQFA